MDGSPFVKAWASGSRIITTGRGRAIMMDTGLNRGTTVAAYMHQVVELAARMGAGSITGVQITHAHADHINRFADTVRRFNIPAENVFIADYQARWAREIRAQWRELAADPGLSRLNYRSKGVHCTS